MILVTGAAGKTGRAVIRALAGRGQPVRALVRREAQIPAVQALGAAEGLAGELPDAALLRQAVEGVAAVYHICPNVNPDELSIARAALAAARQAGVGRFVYHSVLHPQTEAMPHHWQKMRVEEALFEAGLPFTILQPAPYMQNLMASWASIVERGIYSVPYPAETRLSLVDLEDVAEAAARALTGPGHAGATYELVGTPALTQTEVAAALGAQLGREIQVETMDRGQWEQRARAAGMPEYAVGALLQMFEYYERFGLVGSPQALRWLLGRAPASLADFARRAAAA
jgi:uncharacterized protein YbjT (DUF2867 family)